jgi:hypothetical protein
VLLEMQPELMNQRALSDPKASLEDLLHEGTVALGLDLHQACRDKLLAYLNLMIKWNAVFNLTAIRDPRQMLIQHLLDSLSVIPVLRRHLDLDHAELADVGSGAGLPGLPPPSRQRPAPTAPQNPPGAVRPLLSPTPCQTGSSTGGKIRGADRAAL